LAFAQDALDRRSWLPLPLRGVAPDVGHVQEGGALQADLDEGRLHAGQHAHHAAEIDVADDAAAVGALDVQFLHHALLQQRDARFLRREVDQADPGLIMMVRERWPDMPVHLSVQSNTVNWAAVKFWQTMGLSRVILSRELSLDEVEEIRQQCPDMELEVFIHGALCIAYSGRCLLSGYFNHRDPNQGTCTNSCRWDYKVQPAKEDAGGDVWLIEEKERPGEHMPIEEDEHGTYIMNSKDLRAIEHVQKLVAMGIDSLKIEGRTKSPYYAARTCQAYRQAIDDAVAGRSLDPALLAQLDGLANRGYTDGFYQRHHDAEYQNYLRGHSESARSLYVGDVVSYDAARGLAEIDVKNRFAVGDRLEIIHPSGNSELALARMENTEGGAISVAPGNGHRVWVPLPEASVGAYVARFV
jgi:putative protease